MGRFNFEGKVLVGKDRFFRTSKVKRGKNKGSDTATIEFGISTGASTAFVELFGMVGDIYVTTNDGERLVVDWEDRTNPDIVKNVPFYNKHVLSIQSKNIHEEYLSAYDMVLALHDLLKDGYDSNLVCTGRVTRDPYINKQGEEMYITRFTINNVYESKSEDESTTHLKYDEILYFNKDSIDEDSFKEDKRIYVNAYVKQYITKNAAEEYFGGIEDEKGKTFYIPEQFVLDMSKIDFTNDLQKKCAEYVKSNLTKVKSDKKMYAMPWTCSYINGAEEIEFNEDQLTDNQKLEIELGLSTLEDFKPKGTIYGSRIRETRLVKPNTRGDYAEGPVELPETMDEFNEDVAVFVKKESLDEVVESITKEEVKTEVEEEQKSELDKLFDDILG